MKTNDPIFENEEDVVREEGKRFPNAERPELPWDNKPANKGKDRKRTEWERFGDVYVYRRKSIICGAGVGWVIARLLIGY